MQKEIEIKFRCTNGALKTLVHLNNLSPDYMLEKPCSFEIHDIYLDTKDRFLLKKGASLRCRRKDDRLRVTFKSSPFLQGNRLVRDEWEQEVSRGEFQALLHTGRVPGFCASAVQGLVGEKALSPVLALRNHRKVRSVVHNHRGLVAEMSLDDLLFIRNGKEDPCFGIEVELKGEGEEADLEILSKELRKRFPELEPDTETKFEKGMRLSD